MLDRIARKHLIAAAIAGIILFSLIASAISPVTHMSTGESVGLLQSTAITSGLLFMIILVAVGIPLVLTDGLYQNEIEQPKRQTES